MALQIHREHSLQICSEQYGLQTTCIFKALFEAKSTRSRQIALDLLISTLDHHDAKIHDNLCSNGAIALVTRCLQKHDEELQELNNISERELFVLDSTFYLLVILFRCSSECGSVAFQQVGYDLLTILVSILCEYFVNRRTNAITILINCISDLNHVALIAIDKNNLLMRLLQQLIRNEYESSYLVDIGCTLLNGLAKNPINKVELSCRPSLVEDIVSVLFLPDMSDDVKNKAVETLKHLSWEWSIKLAIVSKKNFLKGMVFVLNHKWKDKVLQKKTNQAVIETIGRLATEASCRTRIVSYKNGIFINALMTALQVQELQVVATQTISRLIDQETCQRFLKTYSLQMKNLAASGNDKENNKGSSHSNENKPLSFDYYCQRETNMNNCGNIGFDILSSSCLHRLARYLTVRDPSHAMLLAELTKLASYNNSKSRLCAAKGLREQSRTSTGRFFMARTPQFLDILLVLAKDSCRNVQSSATEALLWFASDSLNVQRLAQRPDVLETFVSNAKQFDNYITCRSAIQAIISIASHELTKARVAKTMGLVEVLSKYGISNDTESDLKSASLHCVIMLVPLM